MLNEAAWFSWEPALAKPALSHLNLPYFREALEGSLECFLVFACVFYPVRPERPQETRQRRRLHWLKSCIKTVPAGADANVGGTPLFGVVVVCNASKRHLSSKVCQTTSMVDWKTLLPTVVEACDNCSSPQSHSQRRRNFLRGETEWVGGGGEMKAVWWRKERWEWQKKKKTERHRAAVLFFPQPSVLSRFSSGSTFAKHARF